MRSLSPIRPRPLTSLDLVKTLAAIPSISRDTHHVNRCTDAVEAYLSRQGLFVRSERINGYRTLYASTVPGKRCDVLLNAHLDVVSAPAAQFRVRQSGHRLTGRGVCDCKGNAAVIMTLLARLKQRACSTSAGAIFTTDEELGGATTAEMVRKGYGGRFTIVLDGPFDTVITAQKGILSVTLEARGKSCHASTPWHGHNALDALIGGYLRIKRLFPAVSDRDSWQRTMAATVIKAGESSNQVPAAAEMTLNIRVTDADHPRALLARIRKVSGLKVRTLRSCPFVRIPETHPDVRLFLASMQRRLHHPVRFGKMNGATDARHFRRSCKALVIFGVRGGGAHAANEWVDIRSFPELEQALFGFIVEEYSRRGR